jgi:hypothetical protein
MLEEAPRCISIGSGWIAVQHTGSLTREELTALRQAVAVVVAERRLCRILYDLTRAVPSSLAASEMVDLCSSNWTALPSGLTIAIVFGGSDQVSAQDARFAESINLSRGVMVKAFSDLEAARRWLSSTPNR